MQKINLGIVEDENIVMDSLISLFSKQLDISIHSTGKSVEDFLENVGIEEMDVLLLDINLPGMSGLEGMRTLMTRMPKCDIIILTTFEDEEVIFKALCGGASGYMSKRTSLSKIAEAVRTVHQGGSFMSPIIAKKVISYFNPASNKTKGEELTRRQKQIVQALVDGCSYKMIADKYMISTHTVRDHIKVIYKKLHVHSKAELIAKSFRGEID